MAVFIKVGVRYTDHEYKEELKDWVPREKIRVEYINPKYIKTLLPYTHSDSQKEETLIRFVGDGFPARLYVVESIDEISQKLKEATSRA